MKKNVATISEDKSAKDAAKIMNRRRIGSIVVFRKKNAVGIITERDILRRVVAAGRNPVKTKCKRIMSSLLLSIDADAEIEDAIEIMIKKKIKKLVVTKDGDLAGIVTATDIIRSGEKIEYATLKKLARFFAIYIPEPQAG